MIDRKEREVKNNIERYFNFEFLKNKYIKYSDVHILILLK